MRISEWSSDVCSSDLAEEAALFKLGRSRVRHLTQLAPFSLACVTGNNAQPCRSQRSVSRRRIVVGLRPAPLRGGEHSPFAHSAAIGTPARSYSGLLPAFPRDGLNTRAGHGWCPHCGLI